MKNALIFLDNLSIKIAKEVSRFFRRLKHKDFKKQVIKETIWIILAILFFFAGFIAVWAVNLKIPDLQSFDETQTVGQSTKIYDSTGQVLLYNLNQDTKRTVVPFDQISSNVKSATIAIEDRNFYQNPGIDFMAILRSMITDITTLHFSEGGSTITQQVVKNLLLTQDKTITRKLKEEPCLSNLGRNSEGSDS